jgi:hypothetical protein
MYRYKKSNGYAPSAQKLFVDIKDIIEQTFPTLHEDIINDALDYGRIAYEEYLSTGASKRDSEASDLEAKEFFLISVTERILEHNRREYDTLIELMLVRERHNTATLRSNKAQDLSSGFIALPSRPIQMVADKIVEENRKQFTQQTLRFPYPGSNPLGYRVDIPEIIRNNPTRIEQFRSLSDKLQRQLARIEFNLVNVSADVRDNLLVQIFDEMYNLSISTYNSNQLERLLIDNVSQIIRTSSLNREQKRLFFHYFTYTINNKDNHTYSQTVNDSFRLT